MTPLETRLLDTLKREGPQTDREITGIGLHSMDPRKALEHLFALGHVTFTKRPGDAKHKWRAEQRHDLPEQFADALRTAFALRRHIREGGPLMFTLEDAEATARILVMLMTGSPLEVRHALRVLEDARNICAAFLDAHRKPS